MNRKLYEALRSLGIADSHAADVSEALSDDVDMHLLKWMVGINLTLTLGILWAVLQVLLKL